MNRLRHTLALLLLTTALVASACSGDGIGRGERTVGDGPQAAPTVAGQVVDGFAPGVNDRVAIIGLQAGETLPMRIFPGTDRAIAAEIPAGTDDLFGFGEAFETPDGRLWWLVQWDEAQGWIEPGAAYLGAANDVSVVVAGSLQSTTYDSPESLVREAAARFGEFVIVDAGTLAESGEIVAVVDSLTSESEAQRGERLVLTMSPGSGSHRLTSAEILPLCARGLNDDGSCA